MAFLTEPAPARGVLLPVLPGVHRVVADNPSVMTYHGTNTYLVEGADGVTVLDPGPDSAAHVADVLRLTPAPIVRILLSHTHRDHLGATAALKAATGAPTVGWHASAEAAFAPDVALREGDGVAGMVVLHTPGHAADHVCFARADGVVFTADHVMGWSSSIVNPPGGDMASYVAQLERMVARPDRLYLPGHGPAIAHPAAYVQGLIDHRVARERAIAAAIADAPASSAALAERLYAKVDPWLKMAAERNVVAHLLKLEREGRVVKEGEVWRGVS